VGARVIAISPDHCNGRSRTAGGLVKGS
jgi:hypothetical protein